jgi:hypothetical protein
MQDSLSTETHTETKLYRMRRVNQYAHGRLDEKVYFVRATSEEQARFEMSQRFFNDDEFTLIV